MTDQTESARENERLLRDIDSAAQGIQRLDRLDAEHIAKAIRALEAKAEAWELDALRYAQNADFWRADRDRLAGEVERLQARHEHARKFDSLDMAQAEVARLTSERDALKAALEWFMHKGRFLSDGNGGDLWRFSGAITIPWDRTSFETSIAAIDAARSAGGEG